MTTSTDPSGSPRRRGVTKHKPLGKPTRGTYRRTLGKFINAQGQTSSRVFTLGSNPKQAEQKNRLLEQAWETNQQAQTALHELQCRELNDKHLDRISVGIFRGDLTSAFVGPKLPDPPDPNTWSSTGLQIVAAMLEGNEAVTIEATSGESNHTYLRRLQTYQTYFNRIRLVPTNADVVEFERDLTRLQTHHLQRRADGLRELTGAPRVSTGPMFHEWLERYGTWVKEHKKTEHGQKEIETLQRIMKHSDDLPLCEVNHRVIESICDYWKGRPEKARGSGPIAVDTVAKHLSVFKRALKWIDRSEENAWSLPRHAEDALTLNKRQIATPEEIAAASLGPRTWDYDHFGILLNEAADFQRAQILLGFNCGFAQSEMRNLTIDCIDESGEFPVLRGARSKMGRGVEFRLWPETVKAIEWLIKITKPHRPADNRFLFIRDDGSRIPSLSLRNKWAALMDRVTRDHPEVPRLSFKAMRKSAGQWVRDLSDGNVMAVFHGRHRSVSVDPHSEVYSRRNFQEVFRVNHLIYEKIKDRIQAVEDLFTSTSRGSKPRSTKRERSTRRKRVHPTKISVLLNQGLDPQAVADQLSIHVSTVYRHKKQVSA